MWSEQELMDRALALCGRTDWRIGIDRDEVESLGFAVDGDEPDGEFDILLVDGLPTAAVGQDDSGMVTWLEVCPSSRRQGVATFIILEMASATPGNIVKGFIPQPEVVALCYKLYGKSLTINEHGEMTVHINGDLVKQYDAARKKALEV